MWGECGGTKERAQDWALLIYPYQWSSKGSLVILCLRRILLSPGHKLWSMWFTGVQTALS